MNPLLLIFLPYVSLCSLVIFSRGIGKNILNALRAFLAV